MTTKQLDFVSIPESQLDQDDDLGKFSFSKFGKALGVLNGGIDAFNGVHGIGQKFGLWDTDSEGVDVVSTSESQLDQDDDLGKFSLGKFGKAFGVINGGIDAFNSVHGIGQKFGLWDADSEDVEVRESNNTNGLTKQPSSSFDTLTGSELIPESSSEFSGQDSDDDLGIGAIAALKGGAKIYAFGKQIGIWDLDSESAELDADTDGSPSWFHMHHDDGINDGYLDAGADASSFDAFLLQSGSDLIAPIAEPFADAAAITNLVTGKSSPMEAAIDPLVAAGPLDAVQVNEPRNNVF